MKKINVLHIIGSLQVGGAEKSLLLLLNNIDRQRFNPVVVPCIRTLVNDFFYEDFRKLNLRSYHLHLRSWRDVATFRQLRKSSGDLALTSSIHIKARWNFSGHYMPD
jgi:hypothetical protein